MKTRKISNLKEVKNKILYYNAVIKAKSKLDSQKKRQIKSIQKKIRNLYNVKNNYIRDILVLKSSFSIIDDMFIKEMKNADIIRKNWFRYFLCCDKTFYLTDPRELNDFVKLILNPHLKYQNNQEENNNQHNNTITLLENNIKLSKDIYDILENGNEHKKLKTNNSDNYYNLTSSIMNYRNKTYEKYENDEEKQQPTEQLQFKYNNSDSDISDMDVNINCNISPVRKKMNKNT
jgi:hypothetical protein